MKTIPAWNCEMTVLSGIRVVSFDGDGTLWDFDKVMRDALDRVLTELERADPSAAARLDTDTLIRIRNEVAEEHRGKCTLLTDIRREAFRRSLVWAGRPDRTLADTLNNLYLRHRFENVKLYEDVLPALAALQPRYTLALASNGNTYPDRCGLENFFSFTLFAQDRGVEKPHPGFFRILRRLAGCRFREILHVGDSLTDDAAGADSVSMPWLWLNREGGERPADLPADREIRSLGEVVDRLGEPPS